MIRILLHLVIVLCLTVLTQIGGLAWLISRTARRPFPVFVVAYAAMTFVTVWIAPSFGRVPLSCFGDGSLKVQSWMYCALNRNYVSPDLKEVLLQTADEMNRRFPETDTLVLDANFPFVTGFPLLPHLSHDDGEKADLAFYYQDETGYLRGATRSPIGYFAFENGPSDGPRSWPTLRWDLAALQPFWRDLDLETGRISAVLQILSDDDRIGKIFIEPHLVETLGVRHSKVRFQGCRAARHDDHIHLQLR
ncbi:MAG: hypothetical protein P8X50_15425 [Maritimibacter sp.]